jgi:aminoglycoside phosphotransferase (APT) family kinase protein
MPESPAVDDLASALSDALDGAAIDGLHRLSGGASRETWSFAADGRPLILQRTRPGSSMSGPSMADEDVLLAAAASAGVPVPPIVADAAACEALLGSARITAHVDGEALGPRIVRDERFVEARSVLVGQCARALAAIHSIDPPTVHGLENVDDPVGRIRLGLDLVEEHRPAFELALRWLDEHRPPVGAPAVVHGDFRVGNLLVDETTGLAAVLDWELAHLGDPVEDLGWLCVRAWRFGGAGEVGGVGPLPDLLDAYAEAGGRPVDPEHVRWWIVAGTTLWGLICAVQARRHLDGHIRSVELATIGRRVCETEYDLLDLIGLASSTDDPKPAETAATEGGGTGVEIHGRPTATELQDAIDAHRAAHPVAADQADAFQSKVADNAQAIVDRERDLGPAIASSAAARLATLGFTDERALASAIRDGELEITPGSAEARTIRALVTDRVRVSNPKWLLASDV